MLWWECFREREEHLSPPLPPSLPSPYTRHHHHPRAHTTTTKAFSSNRLHVAPIAHASISGRRLSRDMTETRAIVPTGDSGPAGRRRQRRLRLLRRNQQQTVEFALAAPVQKAARDQVHYSPRDRAVEEVIKNSVLCRFLEPGSSRKSRLLSLAFGARSCPRLLGDAVSGRDSDSYIAVSTGMLGSSGAVPVPQMVYTVVELDIPVPLLRSLPRSP